MAAGRGSTECCRRPRQPQRRALRGPGADPTGGARALRRVRQGHRPRSRPPPRSRQPGREPPLPGRDPLPRHRELAGLCPRARRPCRSAVLWCRGRLAAQSGSSGCSRRTCSGSAASRPSRSFVWRCWRPSRPTTRAGSSSGTATGHRPRSEPIRSASYLPPRRRRSVSQNCGPVQADTSQPSKIMASGALRYPLYSRRLTRTGRREVLRPNSRGRSIDPIGPREPMRVFRHFNRLAEFGQR